MNLEWIQPFIVRTVDEGYYLEIWESMLKKWGFGFKPSEEMKELEQWLSKMMEFQRACVEEGDKLPIVFMSKDFQECVIHLKKYNGKEMKYILHPYGYQNQWEIFRVVTLEEGNSWMQPK